MLLSIINKNDYIGTGTTATYVYSFHIFEETDLVLTVADADGEETVLTITTDYTVTGEGESAGGNIVFVDSGQDWIDANGYLKTGYALNIKRTFPLTQSADIRNQGVFYPESHEDVFDRLICIVQQLQEQIDRSVKASVTSDVNINLPNPQDGYILSWDGTGGDLENVPYDSTSLAGAVAAAEAAQAAAETAQTAAETAETNAETAETNAETAETNAEAAATAAEAARDTILALDLLVQREFSSSSTPGSGVGTIPLDSTIPQNTEGQEVLTGTITPQNASNYLDITIDLAASIENLEYAVFALFQDSIVNALASKVFIGTGTSGMDNCVLKYRMVAGTTNQITFKMRFGRAQTGTTYWNQTGTGLTMGGTLITSITIDEVEV